MAAVPVHIFLSFSVNLGTVHPVLPPHGELPRLGFALDLLCLGRAQVSGLCDQNLHLVSEISLYSTLISLGFCPLVDHRQLLCQLPSTNRNKPIYDSQVRQSQFAGLIRRSLRTIAAINKNHSLKWIMPYGLYSLYNSARFLVFITLKLNKTETPCYTLSAKNTATLTFMLEIWK